MKSWSPPPARPRVPKKEKPTRQPAAARLACVPTPARPRALIAHAPSRKPGLCLGTAPGCSGWGSMGFRLSEGVCDPAATGGKWLKETRIKSIGQNCCECCQLSVCSVVPLQLTADMTRVAVVWRKVPTPGGLCTHEPANRLLVGPPSSSAFRVSLPQDRS